MLPSLALVISLGLCQAILADQTKPPRSARLVSPIQTQIEDEVVNDVTQAKPYWIKPETMLRTVFAEHLGSKVRLKCSAGGEPKPDIKWFKNGVALAQVTRPSYLPPFREKADKFELSIAKLTKSDEGDYTCIVSNVLGSLNQTFTVEAMDSINHRPILIDQSRNQTVMEGMDVELFCRFRSDLATMIHWLKSNVRDGETFDSTNANHFRMVNGTNGLPAMGETIHIAQAKPSDSGMYFCVAQTIYDKEPGFLHLTVLARNESLLEKPENLTVREGSTAVFTCRTHLELHKHMSWVRLNPDDIVELVSGTEALRIENVTKADAGTYACVIGTEAGYIQEVASLQVQDHDAPPATPLGSASHKKMSVWAVSVSLLAAVLIIMVLLMYRRFRLERIKKQQAIANGHLITQWTKKVIIERQPAHFDPSAPITAPVIRIEKQSSTVNSANRSRLGSENTTLTTVSEYELPLDPEWEINRSCLTLGCILGEGAFGKVVKAEMRLETSDKSVTDSTIVAVKMLKEGHTDQEMIDLVSEMDTLKLIGRHDNVINIINLIGVCTRDGPLYVVVEYAEHGNLRDFLRKFGQNIHDDGYEKPAESRKSISARQLISFARQVCKGMEFLASKKCIHRDLAARNVLVATDYVIKIADFGLARDVHGQDYYKKMGDGRLPVKWMAPETLFHRRYTSQSDVWSFGILMWEIMTLGANPYPSVPTIETLFQLLKKGYRMDSPPNCSAEIYSIMRDCWNYEPTLRPTFSGLIDQLDRIVTYSSPDYLDMSFTGELYCGSTNGSEFSAPGAHGLPRSSSPIRSHHLPYSNTVQNQAYQNSFMPAPPTVVSISSIDEEGSGVTYTPLLSTFNPYTNHRNSYVNHPMVLQPYVNGHYHQYDGSNEDCMSEQSPLDDMNLDDFNENYSEHLKSSVL